MVVLLSLFFVNIFCIVTLNALCQAIYGDDYHTAIPLNVCMENTAGSSQQFVCGSQEGYLDNQCSGESISVPSSGFIYHCDGPICDYAMIRVQTEYGPSDGAVVTNQCYVEDGISWMAICDDSSYTVIGYNGSNCDGEIYYAEEPDTGGTVISCTNPTVISPTITTTTTTNPTPQPQNNIFPSAVLQTTNKYDTDEEYADPNEMNMPLFSYAEVGNVQLSDNFNVSEFLSRDGADGFRLSPTLVECLQSVRDDLGKAVNIPSAYRTHSHNEKVNGSETSMHLSGTAADISADVSIMTLADSVIYNCRNKFQEKGYDIGLGLGAGYIHVDMRKSHGSWVYDGAPLSADEWKIYIENKSNTDVTDTIETTSNTDVTDTDISSCKPNIFVCQCLVFFTLFKFVFYVFN